MLVTTHHMGQKITFRRKVNPGLKRKFTSKDWLTVDPLLGTMSDCAIAARYPKFSPASISRRRRKLGIAQYHPPTVTSAERLERERLRRLKDQNEGLENQKLFYGWSRTAELARFVEEQKREQAFRLF